MPFEQKAEVVQDGDPATRREVVGAQDRNSCPMYVMHEYEGLLFSDPDLFAEAIAGMQVALAGKLPRPLIRNQFRYPRRNSLTRLVTAPSKRRRNRLAPGYQEAGHGDR